MNIFKKIAKWYKDRKEEKRLEEEYQKKLKEIKKRDPYTYD